MMRNIRMILWSALVSLLIVGGARAIDTVMAPTGNWAMMYNGPTQQASFRPFTAGNKAPTAQVLAPAGLLYTTTASAATAGGTSEQTLGTYSLPANALDITGRRIRMRASFTAAGNGNNKTFKCYFGASVITSGVLTTNAKNGTCNVEVVKTGSSTQIVWANMSVDTTPITGYVNLTGTDTDTAAIVIKMTGTDGTDSAADIVLNDMYVEYLN